MATACHPVAHPTQNTSLPSVALVTPKERNSTARKMAIETGSNHTISVGNDETVNMAA
jgi:hypothetical protein